ncbi:RpiB/LacA/LacB family sugar-phosphate isomerase [Candidatus Saccharibacteria bacterium]|nr:RpiB/LacA/LacB family sugar-phosphate isomerase [Candidatus Saccharibacteria bacterium]
MDIYIGADYKGLERKNELVKFLVDKKYNVTDVGAYSYHEGDDFNDPAIAVARSVRRELGGAKGILICGSGHGMTIQANRFNGIRATLCDSVEAAVSASQHDDANILCLSAERVDLPTMKKIATTFLETKFEPLERRVRRINRMDERGDYD